MVMEIPQPEKFFTVKEFAWLFDVSERVVRERIRGKEIRVLPLHRHYRIPLSEYDRCKQGVFAPEKK